MATIHHQELRPEIRKALKGLRRRIRAYVLLEGTALVLVVVGALFWLSLGINQAYFRVSNLELPQWFRAAFVAVGLAVAGFAALFWVAHGLLRRMRARALAIVLERRFPELDDRLITAVEASEQPTGFDSPLSIEMLRRTVEDAARAADRLPVRTVFRRAPLGWALTGAGVLVASVVALGLTNAPVMANWIDAYWNLKEEYWNRDTLLVARVIAPPADELRDFTRTEDGHLYKHPRGGDLELHIEVPPYNAAGKPMKVPEQIEIQYRLASGAKGTITRRESSQGSRHFRHTFPEQQEDLVFWVKGGDYINRRPYRVQMVSQPQVQQMVLHCDYPDYTGLDRQFGARQVAVTQGKVSLPVETRFLMQATANKPLSAVRLQTEAFELRLTCDESVLTLYSQDGRPQRDVTLPRGAAGLGLSADGRTFRVPFITSTRQPRQLAESVGQLLAASPLPPLEAARTLAAGEYVPLPLAPVTAFRMFLRDTDNVENIEPARLTIESLPDQPPQFESISRYGIGDIISRNALIPISGKILDDYGVTRARFEYRIDEQPWQPAADKADEPGPHRFFNEPQAGADGAFPTEFAFRTPKRPELLTGNETEEERFENAERFSVMPLNLDLGQKLTLRIYAADGDTINGPHVGRSTPEFTFTIVTDDELLGYLHEREVNLRLEFEKAIKEIRTAEQDLTAALSLTESAGADAPPSADMQNGLAEAASRAFQTVRKNHDVSIGIETAFDGILQELLNNQLRTGQQVARIRDLIIHPLHAINEQDFDAADKALGALDVVLRDGQPPTAHAQRSVAEMRTLLEHMQQVLEKMQKLADLNEAKARLKQIIQETETLQKEIEEQQQREFKNKLELLE